MSHSMSGCPTAVAAPLLRLAESVQRAVDHAVEALFSLDAASAGSLAGSGAALAVEQVAVEEAAADLLSNTASDRPDPQSVLSAVRAGAELTAVGGCAVELAHRAARLSRCPDFELPDDLRMLANSVISILQETLSVLETHDPASVCALSGGDDVVDSLHRQIVQDVQMRLGNDASQAAAKIDLLLAAGLLNRIADHCSRIAAEFGSLVPAAAARRIAC